MNSRQPKSRIFYLGNAGIFNFFIYEIKFSNCFFQIGFTSKKGGDDENGDTLPTALKTVAPMEKIFQCLLSLVFNTLCSVPNVRNLCAKGIPVTPGSRGNFKCFVCRMLNSGMPKNCLYNHTLHLDQGQADQDFLYCFQWYTKDMTLLRSSQQNFLIPHEVGICSE